MEKIFTSIADHLDTEVTELRWVDMQKGQMNFEKPPVVFPCALIKVIIPASDNITKKLQSVNGVVEVSYCFDFTGKTNNKMLKTQREKSLTYLRTVDKAHKALQAFETNYFSNLQRTSAIEQERPDGYKVLMVSYTTTYREDTSD